MASGFCFHDVAPNTHEASFFHEVDGRFLTEENDSGVWDKLTKPPSDLDAVHRWQAEVQKNQIRF